MNLAVMKTEIDTENIITLSLSFHEDGICNIANQMSDSNNISHTNFTLNSILLPILSLINILLHLKSEINLLRNHKFSNILLFCDKNKSYRLGSFHHEKENHL